MTLTKKPKKEKGGMGDSVRLLFIRTDVELAGG